MANGLIKALAIMTDNDEPDYILTVNQVSDDSFSSALNNMMSGSFVRLKGWPKTDYLKYTKSKQKFHYVTMIRGREELTEIPMSWITSIGWERYDE
jgi:hypothetical protein